MVDVGEHPQHLRCGGASSGQSMDVPQVSSDVRYDCSMGSDWTRAAVWTSWSVQEHDMAIPTGGPLTNTCVDFKQKVPGQKMDFPNQHPSYNLWLHRNSTCSPNQHCQLDCHGFDLQPLSVQVPERMVAEVQLCFVFCFGCRDGFHGGSVVFCSSEFRQKLEVVGN